MQKRRLFQIEFILNLLSLLYLYDNIYYIFMIAFAINVVYKIRSTISRTLMYIQSSLPFLTWTILEIISLGGTMLTRGPVWTKGAVRTGCTYPLIDLENTRLAFPRLKPIEHYARIIVNSFMKVIASGMHTPGTLPLSME